ncbi:alpha/beta hydrolase-fold protein [Streptomyces sp. NBC_00320]|uniref:alpha/beta hydrolase n=1 Tax=Streptomyces sp. NBC_00320 TaxID=2975711 RepID=UPI002251890F|nr:alpha/beta hydrolase-fold protein [Streptomyces sp. NBC_00320]MCX5149495.1 alpha/beta hydrolase-fold protein [Streptomyces sp. NBC_00320]
MSLTSGMLLIVVVLATLLAFASAVWLWPRLGGRGRRTVFGRVGVVLTLQVLLLASIGLTANRTFLLYGSWADLAGVERPMPPMGEGAQAGSGVRLLGRQPTDVPGGGTPHVGGEIEKVAVQGERSKAAVQAYVYLPPEYFQKGNEDRRFPATVVLTGFPGMAQNLLKGLDYPKTAWKLAKQKKMPPMIMVMMQPSVVPTRNTQCIDVPGGPLSETFFGTDLPKAISGAYRVGTSPSNWAIMGDSTGGYCALKVALEHPEHYAAGVGLSADYKPEIDEDSGDLFHGNTAEEKRSDLLWSLDNLPQGKSSFLVATSQQGEGNYKPTQKFIEKVKAPARVSSITLDHGGHGFNTWRREIPPAMQWLGGRIGAE